MSPVLDDFIAILKSINSKATSSDIKQILIETSYSITETNDCWYNLNQCSNVIDMGLAAKIINETN